ncbi:MAG: hypothetical protein LBI67_12595 [Treponema sp.]|nr:hypothetical protein [Treponema sp.]
MKKLVVALALAVSIIGSNFADENQRNSRVILYTFFVNIVAGPSMAWTYSNNGNEAQEPFMNVLKYEINERHKLFFGGRIALRAQW